MAKYITELLDRSKMLGARPSATPITVGTKLSQHDGDRIGNASLYPIQQSLSLDHIGITRSYRMITIL